MKNNKQSQELYKTKDIFIASTLFAQKIKLFSTDWVNDECFFCFENKEKSEEIVRKYYIDDIKIAPKKLFNGFKDIKSILFSKR